MPKTSGLTHTPVTTFLLLASTALTIAVSLLDGKPYLPVHPTPHLYPYLQLSRLLTYQSAYLNSSELLFSTVLLYQLRVLERLWGSRKYASFLLTMYAIQCVVTPFLVILLKMLTWGRYNYIPPGLTGFVCAGVACWREETPVLFRYKLLTQGAPGSSATRGLVLSDKATTYVLAAQLALSQFPWNLMPAGVGWVVGLAWKGDLLPAGIGRWRVPGWMVGEGGRRKKDGDRESFEGLRRRLEEEGSNADGMRGVTASGVGVEGDGAGARRRGLVGQVGEYFRGVF